MWQLSGFADEISADFADQCRLLRTLGMHHLGMHHLELRSAWDTNVLDFDEAQLTEVARLLAGNEIAVSSIGSPIGKIFLDEDFTMQGRHRGNQRV
jgi:hypothetical protein